MKKVWQFIKKNPKTTACGVVAILAQVAKVHPAAAPIADVVSGIFASLGLIAAKDHKEVDIQK